MKVNKKYSKEKLNKFIKLGLTKRQPFNAINVYDFESDLKIEACWKIASKLTVLNNGSDSYFNLCYNKLVNIDLWLLIELWCILKEAKSEK